MISTRKLRALGRKVGLVKRKRKVDAMPLFWSIVLGFGAGIERTLAGLRRAYVKSSGVKLTSSAFYKRFTVGLLGFFRAVVAETISKVDTAASSLEGVLSEFEDLLITDSTLVKLHDLLEKRFPGARTNSAKASAKLHAVLSVKGRGPRSIKITSGRQHDRPVLQVGRWVRGRLFLGDLGFFHYQLFDCIDRNDGYFISRLKENANPLIVSAYREWRGQSLPIVGEKLRDVAERLQRAVIDVEVEVLVKRRVYRGKQSRVPRRFRLVGLIDEATGKHHFYLTNIPPEKISAEKIGKLYSARWLIELVWKEMKSNYGLAEMPSAKAHIVETLLLATVMTLFVSKRLLLALRAALGVAGARRVPEQRWAALFSTVALEILGLLLLPARLAQGLACRLERMLLVEALDPNATRPLLLARATEATC